MSDFYLVIHLSIINIGGCWTLPSWRLFTTIFYPQPLWLWSMQSQIKTATSTTNWMKYS